MAGATPTQAWDSRGIVEKMSLEEKAQMVQGADFWHLRGVERLGVPSVMVSDGPHGLRQQSTAADHLGVNDAREAVCFPSGCALAASFDEELLGRLGDTIGAEARARELAVVLGPAMNIKRSPLCGRNFEYLSEDPHLSSRLAAAYVRGVQAHGVGTSPKHFAANNQERRRMTMSSNVDERTLREIYLASFETMVRTAKPWTVMCSYNRVNGTYASQNRELLTEILREEWGFDGFVVSDWGAVVDHVAGLKAGLDLEMPNSGEASDRRVVEAVRSGELEEEVLDEACRRIIDVIGRCQAHAEDAHFDIARDHQVAREIDGQCIVLLRNEGVLPLASDARVAFLGEFAQSPRFQGGGSSHITTSTVVSALDAAQDAGLSVTYAPGYRAAAESEEPDAALIEEAVELATSSDVAVVFAGLPDSFESEGYDRTHLNLPASHNALISAVAAAQPNTVVVLHNGSPVAMPWREDVAGIVEAYLGGEAVGEAVVDVLTGAVNPSGRLAETFPLALEDTPCRLNYGFNSDEVHYGEGVYVGYRHYATTGTPVAYPFGFGLSYTEFSYSGLAVSVDSAGPTVSVDVTVTNTGERAGREVVQLYVRPEDPQTARPLRELRGFRKVALEPGESTRVQFQLGARAFAYWHVGEHGWVVDPGSYAVELARDALTPVLSETVTLEAWGRTSTVGPQTRLGDLLADPAMRAKIEDFAGTIDGGDIFGVAGSDSSSEAISMDMAEAMMADMPLRQLASFNDAVSRDDVDRLIERLNGE